MTICKNCGHEIKLDAEGYAYHKFKSVLSGFCRTCGCTNPEPINKCAYCGYKNLEFVTIEGNGGCSKCFNKRNPEPKEVDKNE